MFAEYVGFCTCLKELLENNRKLLKVVLIRHIKCVVSLMCKNNND